MTIAAHARQVFRVFEAMGITLSIRVPETFYHTQRSRACRVGGRFASTARIQSVHAVTAVPEGAA